MKQGTDRQWTRSHLAILGMILLAYVLIVWHALQAPLMIGDDTAQLAYIRSHPALWQIAQYDCFYFFRPAKNLLFLGFNALLPLGLPACRLLAVVLGLLSALSVHLLFRRLLRAPYAALSATACWLLAPTMLACTVWLSCVNIQVMIGLAAAAVLLFLKACERTTDAHGRLLLAGAWAASLLALLCYEGAVVLPGLLVLLLFFLYPERLRERRIWRAGAVLVSALVLYLLLRTCRTPTAYRMAPVNFGEMTDWQVIAAAPWFFFQHLSIWLWPFGRQAVLGGYVLGQVSPWLLGCAWVAALALITGTLLLRRRLPIASLGVAWCLVAFLPVSNILAFRNGPYGDYYFALPSLGLALAFGWGVGALAARRQWLRGAGLALAAVVIWRLAAVGESAAWARAWNDPKAMLDRTVRTFPRAFGAINEYARVCYRQGAYDECLALTDRSLALAPCRRDAYELRALVAERRGDVTQAQKELERFMQYGGTDESWGWFFQGYLLDEHLGDTNGATRCYRQAVAHRVGWTPDVLQAMTTLGFFAAQRGDRREAVDLWEQVLRADPAQQAARQNLVRAYLENGETNRAWECMQWKPRANGSTAAGR